MTHPAVENIPPLKENGFKGIMGALSGGFTMQSKAVIQVGAAPLVVDLEALGMQPMADTDYVVIAQIEGVAATVDESTKTTAGFNVLLGSASDVCNLLVCGRIKGQSAES